MRKMFSVIIPAHNEESVIGRCLEALLAGAGPGDLEVVVVANGCSDATAQVARGFGSRVIVEETEVPSKWRALNLGDRRATCFPRLYVDADVDFSFHDARSVAEALEEGALAAAPALRFDTSSSSMLVKSHLRIWQRLPIIQRGLMGRGVYGLSVGGRSRFDAFPDLIADDHFVHHLFTDGERVVVEDAVSTVRAPQRLSDLIRRKTRSYVGLNEARESAGHDAGGGSTRDWLAAVRSEPSLVVDLPAYLGVSVFAKILARYRELTGRAGEWTRDASSRESGR